MDRPARWPPVRVLRVYAVVVTLAVLALLTPQQGGWRSVLFGAVLLVGTALAAWSLLRSGRPQPDGWLLTAGTVGIAVGGLPAAVGHGAASATTWWSFTAQCALLAGVLVRARRGRLLGLSGALVGLIALAGISMFLVLAVSSGQPEHGGLGAVLFVAARFLQVVGAVMLLRAPAAGAADRILVGSLLVQLAADLLFVGQAPPTLAEALLLLGLCAMTASVAVRAISGEAEPRTPTVVRDLTVTAVAGLCLPVTVLVLACTGRSGRDVLALTGISLLALVAAMIARMVELLASAQRQAARLALREGTDPLTGLPNRHRLTATIADRMAGAEHDGVHPVVLQVGIDDFGELHARLGQRTTDQLQVAVARRVVATMPDAMVAHLRADVFGVLVTTPHPDRLSNRAQRLVDALREPLELPQLSLSVRPVVGEAVGGPDLHDAAELVANADLALAAARGPAGPVVRFSADLERRDALAAELVGDLADAIERGEVVVYFQPQVEVESGRVSGAEALVRWLHPSLGLLGPAAFVPAAEATGAIRMITLHVLDQALSWCARWAEGGRPLKVAVNLSARDLMHARLVDDVREALARHGVPPSRLELEITETMAMADVELSKRVLTDLARIGVTLSIDDYGTGYGSLAYLQQLPVRRLKIDRSFVSRVLDDEASGAIVRSTIELAAELGLDTVAEGVEDEATLRRLYEYGCTAVQGFGLAAPMSPEGFERAIWRLEHRPRATAVPRSRPGYHPGPVDGVQEPTAAFPSVARAYYEVVDHPSAVPRPMIPGLSVAQRPPAPTRRALRADPTDGGSGAGSVAGLRAAAASERTTGLNPA